MNIDKPTTPDRLPLNKFFSCLSTSLKTPESRPSVSYLPGDTLFADAEGNRKELYDFNGEEVVCPMHQDEVVLCGTLHQRNYSTGFYCPKCVKTYWALPDWHVACRQCGIPDSLSAMYDYGFCYDCCDPDVVSGSPDGEPMQ